MIDIYFHIVTSSLIFWAYICVLCYYFYEISVPIILGAILRYIMVMLSSLGFELPDSNGDMIYFYQTALAIADVSLIDSFYIFPGFAPETMSWIGSFVLRVFGEHVFALQLVSASVGIGCIALTYKLSFLIFGAASAKKSSWVISLFPTHILYSGLFLRDIYATFFILIGVLNYVKFYFTNRLVFAHLSCVAFVVGAAFHGAIIVGFGIILIISIFDAIKKLIYLKFRYNSNTFLLMLALIICSAGILLDVVSINKVSNFISSSDRWFLILGYSAEGLNSSASYPVWLVPRSILESFVLLPARIIYFISGPFPWDVKFLTHFLAVLIGGIYFYFTILALKTILKRSNSNPGIVIIFLFLILYVCVYAYFVSNFGTSTRHKLKVLPYLVVLASPTLPTFLVRFRLARNRKSGIS